MYVLLFYDIHLSVIVSLLQSKGSREELFSIRDICEIQMGEWTFYGKHLSMVHFRKIYMIDSVECKKQLSICSTAKRLVKGYALYKSGHVIFIRHLNESGKHYVKSKALPAMKKHAVYSCYPCVDISW
jgi:hypothetical protein